MPSTKGNVRGTSDRVGSLVSEGWILLQPCRRHLSSIPRDTHNRASAGLQWSHLRPCRAHRVRALRPRKRSHQEPHPGLHLLLNFICLSTLPRSRRMRVDSAPKHSREVSSMRTYSRCLPSCKALPLPALPRLLARRAKGEYWGYKIACARRLMGSSSAVRAESWPGGELPTTLCELARADQLIQRQVHTEDW